VPTNHSLGPGGAVALVCVIVCIQIITLKIETIKCFLIIQGCLQQVQDGGYTHKDLSEFDKI